MKTGNTATSIRRLILPVLLALFELAAATQPAVSAQPVVATVDASKTGPPISDEWAYNGASHPVYPAFAWVFHEMFRHSDVFQNAVTLPRFSINIYELEQK